MMIKRFISKFMTQRHPKLIDPQCGKPHRPTPEMTPTRQTNPAHSPDDPANQFCGQGLHIMTATTKSMPHLLQQSPLSSRRGRPSRNGDMKKLNSFPDLRLVVSFQ